MLPPEAVVIYVVWAASEGLVWVCNHAAAESVTMAMAHITTKGHEDVPGLDCRLGSC